MNKLPPDEAPRIVRPRIPKSDHRYVIAISRDWIVLERSEETFPIEDLGRILFSEPSSILVTQGFGPHIQRLQRMYEGDIQFNYRLTPLNRYARPWNNGHRVDQGHIVDSICNFIGWKSTKKHIPNRYHYPIDPIWFLTASIDDLNDSDEPRLRKLYKWGIEVRDWCLEQNLQIKASAGGLAAQLLRDQRFWPEPRRKVPRFINDTARYQLPGNYYRLHADTDRTYDAVYLDMENAHHSMASVLTFPDPNSLHAYGDWSYGQRLERNPDAKPRAFAPASNALLRSHGLFHARLSVPHIPSHLFPPPYMERPGERDVYLYSNELELVESLGGKVTGIHAAYVSRDSDHGLNKYAKFAVDQIRAHPKFKPWLKPTLHASYGLLAARPVPFETGYLRANGGEPGEYHMGPVSLPAIIKKRPHEIESRIANVIHRGMIEAAVRAEALRFARFLREEDGHTILAIYADAIFIEDQARRFARNYNAPRGKNDGRALKLMPPPWRVSDYVSGLRFHSAVHFTSPSISRLPGVPRTARERFLRHRADIEHLNAMRGKESDAAQLRRRKPPKFVEYWEQRESGSHLPAESGNNSGALRDRKHNQ